MPIPTIRPMEPVLAGEVKDDEDWLYQVKWDGVRMLAHTQAGRVQLINRRQNLRTDTYPDIVSAVSGLSLAGTVLDGEVVVIRDGRPCFASVMRRDAVRAPRADLVARLPAVYVVFDLLYADDRCLCELPLYERLERLRDAVCPGPVVVVTDDHDSGTSLLRVMRERRWEGIVCKRRASRYRPGKHRDWQKVKVRQVRTFPVVGWTERDGRPRSLLLGLPGDRSQVVGRVASGLSAREWAEARTRLTTGSERSIARPGGELWHLVDSELGAVVEFQEWTADLGLRSPVVLSLATRPGIGDGADDGRTHGGDR